MFDTAIGKDKMILSIFPCFIPYLPQTIHVDRDLSLPPFHSLFFSLCSKPQYHTTQYTIQYNTAKKCLSRANVLSLLHQDRLDLSLKREMERAADQVKTSLAVGIPSSALSSAPCSTAISASSSSFSSPGASGRSDSPVPNPVPSPGSDLKNGPLRTPPKSNLIFPSQCSPVSGIEPASIDSSPKGNEQLPVVSTTTNTTTATAATSRWGNLTFNADDSDDDNTKEKEKEKEKDRIKQTEMESIKKTNIELNKDKIDNSDDDNHNGKNDIYSIDNMTEDQFLTPGHTPNRAQKDFKTLSVSPIPVF